MSDFMKWLYAQYIKPRIDAAPGEEYESDLDLLRNSLERPYRQSYEKAAEFIALHAFQLGVRTGKGLADSFHN
ncbi:MAG: hypothetical protein HFG01_12980 [Oscillibacter sp.]|jgi:hypothetical protein|nr:hypothetical protein [Oscillibacter sp.]